MNYKKSDAPGVTCTCFGWMWVVGALFMAENPALASFESSLIGIKTKLTGLVLPLLAVIGLGFAAISFFTGSQDAKRHVIYALIGCIIGFGADAIVSFIAQTVN